MTDEAQGSRRPRAHVVLALVLLALGSTEWRGYRFGGSNQSLQVPLLKHLVDPSSYAGDPVLASFDGYSSYFFHLLAPLVKMAGAVEPVYFALYLVFHLAALAALFLLGRLWFASGAAGTIACLLYIAVVPSLGAEFTYGPRLTHAHAASALLAWALYFHAAGRSRLAFVLCGLTFNIHALYAAYLGAILAFDSIPRLRAGAARAVIVDAALAAALAAPTLIWMLGRGDAVAPADWPQWLAVMRERSSLHTFPFSVPAFVFGRYFLILALGGLAWAAVPDSERHRLALSAFLVVAVLCAIGVIGSEIVPVRRVIEAQLLRSSRWLTVIVLLYVARLVERSWSWGGLARAAAVAIGLGFLLHQPGWMAIGLLLYLLTGAGRVPAAVLAASGVALVVAAASGATDLPDRLGLQQLSQLVAAVLDRPVVLACAAAFAVVHAASRAGASRPDWLPAAAAAAAILYAVPRMYHGHHEALRAEPWNDVQLWAREHTPRNAVFLTPPYREGFRVLSERAIVGEWKDGTQQFFSWTFAKEWRDRIRELGDENAAVYDGLSSDQVTALARKYGAEYAVVVAASSLKEDRVYENAEFAVYRVPRIGAASAAP